MRLAGWILLGVAFVSLLFFERAWANSVKLDLCPGWALWKSPANDLYIVCPGAKVTLPTGSRVIAQDYVVASPPGSRKP